MKEILRPYNKGQMQASKYPQSTKREIITCAEWPITE